MSIKELREKYGNLVTEARKLMEGGNLNEEAEARFDALMADADKVQKHIEREEKVVEAEARAASRIAEAAELSGRSDDEERNSAENYAKAFRAMLTSRSVGDLSPEYRSVLESRAQSVSGGSPAGIYGGYLVPEEFDRNLEKAMLAFGGMLESGKRIVTATGADLIMPNTNDTGNSGAILGENQPVTEQDVVFTQTTLGSHTYTSKLIRVSWALAQDSAIDLDSLIGELAGERIGRVLNSHFTTGNGTTQPQGVVTGATSGVTAAGTTGVSLAELIDLEHSVGRAYRSNGKYMFNDATLKALRKMLDADGRPLWQPSLTSGVPTTFNGREYVINDDVASMAAAAKPILFGDFSHFLIRQVKGYTLVPLRERYADQLQTGYFVFARFDSKLRNAGQNPIKFITMKSASP